MATIAMPIVPGVDPAREKPLGRSAKALKSNGQGEGWSDLAHSTAFKIPSTITALPIQRWKCDTTVLCPVFL